MNRTSKIRTISYVVGWSGVGCQCKTTRNNLKRQKSKRRRAILKNM